MIAAQPIPSEPHRPARRRGSGAPPAPEGSQPDAGGARISEPRVEPAVRQKDARIFAQDPHGWYVEPGDVSTALFEAEGFEGEVWDPACGQGNAVIAALEAGLPACGTDIVRRAGGAPWFVAELDFLKGPGLPADNIVCNPPSFGQKGTEAFIRRAVHLVRRKAAIFVSLRFLCGEERARGLYREMPPTKVWFVTPRCACPPGDYLLAGGKRENGNADYAWLVWRKDGGGRLQAPEAPGWLVRSGR